MTLHRNIARVSTLATAGIAILIAQRVIGQGLPGVPVCQGSPPTPATYCRVNGECAENDTCKSRTLGAIVESSRTWCCKTVIGEHGIRVCIQYTGYWRCCQGTDEPPRWFSVCKKVGELREANCDGHYCN
jgi:hypothetical protein